MTDAYSLSRKKSIDRIEKDDFGRRGASKRAAGMERPERGRFRKEGI